MNHFLRHGALLLAASMATAGPAMATASSTAAVSNLQFQVIDLDPNDGIAAGISFSFADTGGYCQARGNASCPNYASVELYQESTRWFEKTQSGINAVWAPNAAQLTAPIGSAQARIETGPTSLSFTASGLVNGSLSNDPLVLSNYWTTAQLFGGAEPVGITLTRNTLLVITGTATVASSTTDAGTVPYPGGSDSPVEYAEAYLSLQVSLPGATGTKDGNTWIDYSLWSYSQFGASESNSGAISAWFANTSDQALQGTLAVSLTADGFSYVPGVPEPSSWALFGAGLGLLGAWARRRSARR